jgi:hypothetical protein
MDQVLHVLSGAGSSPPAFAITFDDGYESVFTHALPILESLSIPATVFLTSGFLDGAVAPPWRSSDSALLAEYRNQAEHFRPMSWEQARRLAAHPLLHFGSHSVSHPLPAPCRRSQCAMNWFAAGRFLPSASVLCRTCSPTPSEFAGMALTRRQPKGWSRNAVTDAH